MTVLARALRELLLPIADGIRTSVRALTGDPNPTATPAEAWRATLAEGDQQP